MNIKTDSRKVRPGDVFIALDNGHNYVLDAIEKGASKVIVEKGMYEIETVVVPNTRDYLVKELKDNYYSLISELKLIGVTGTNGKTTTCNLIYQALNKLNRKCAYIGTIGFYIEDKIKDLSNTTPDILDLFEMLIECKERKCKYVVLEVSSHSLEFKRVNELLFDYVIFTNLTRDHLDYHKTMDNYLNAKLKLFDLIKEETIQIVNNDDSYKNFFLREETITYGFNNANYFITDYSFKQNKTVFKVNNNEYEMKLIGKYNVYNIVNVIIILDLMGYDYVTIKETVVSLDPVRGRMEKIIYQDNSIIVDYAHTPDAVLNVIETMKELLPNRIITIIGCGGNRDKTKRSLMGTIATDLSDYVIFTSDNPRMENPLDILTDMISNVEKNNFEIIENRSEAINKGIQMLKSNDILLVLGKGHETYQIIKNKKIYFSDKEEILKVINRR